MRNIVRIAAAMLVLNAVPALADGDAAKGEALFKRCSACHAIGEGAKNKIGPQLNGVVGRTAGTATDYNYSNAMKEAGAAGQIWTIEELRDFLSAPRKKIPGNKMAVAGITKPDDLENLVAYLQMFSGGN
ncbi:cytochrome C [Pararhizobium polonicum]|uniref:Cytochrome C n=1 Tax=Pararhizobium polonicum TaxID=1612624 RepID=A0A1C7NWQ8_9HYPH|nr:cytochrome c family protein [Pararhizobium polonicum]OBZ93457.1 cytochrome C [Pararhizobium polonicum]